MTTLKFGGAEANTQSVWLNSEVIRRNTGAAVSKPATHFNVVDFEAWCEEHGVLEEITDADYLVEISDADYKVPKLAIMH